MDGWFDRLTMSGWVLGGIGVMANTSLILSLSKDVKGGWFDKLTMSG